MERNREIIAYGNRFRVFYKSQNLKTQQKIDYTFDLIRFERNIPGRFFKYLINTDGIYEIRIITAFKNIRILCFFETGDLIVLTNCFLKKTQKVPKKDIILAQKLKKEYIKGKYGRQKNGQNN